MSLRLEVAKRNYELESLKARQKPKQVRDHPLQNLDSAGGATAARAGGFGGGVTQMRIEAREEKNQELDGDLSGEDGGIEEKLAKFDPLADFNDLENPQTLDFETWEAKKLKIFAMFKELTDGQDIGYDLSGKSKQIDQTIRMGQGKNRQDALDSKTAQANPHTTMISAKEFTQQLERLDKEMTKYWNREDKVQCIRISIQCAKLLNDTTTPLFYPQKFILLTDILDNFSLLVRGRMRKLTKIHSNDRIIITDENEATIDFTQIPEKVKQIAFNWHNKVSCIREVLPRIYLELAMVSFQNYMSRGVHHKQDLVRLAKMIRGIAEPLCASFTCAYLARVGYNLDPTQKDYLLLLVEYMFKLYDSVVENGHSQLPDEQYQSLFDPTVDWLIQCFAYQADRKLFQDIWAIYQNHGKHAIFLKSIIRYFPSEIISVTVQIMINSINQDFTASAEETNAQKKKKQIDDQLLLIKELGLALLRSPPKKNKSKLDFINFGWERMGLTHNPDKYMDCSIVLIEFSIKSLNQSSVQTFIKEIFKRFQDFALSMNADDTLFKKLEFLLAKVMMTSNDFSELIGFENLLGLLNYFPQNMKQKLCEKMLGFYCSQPEKLSDGFLIHSVFQVAKTLHDKIDFMSEQKEIDRVSEVIIQLIKKVDHGKDLDKTLNVYTDARGLFINLDKVTESLIDLVISLAVRCHKLCKGKHTQKTQTFVKACIAYVHITIPTLESYPRQITLFRQTAQAALLNGLIGETDSLLKGMLATIDENFEENYAYLEMTTQSVLSALGFMVMVPSNPDDDFFQVPEGFIQLIKMHNWAADEHCLLQIRIYEGVIKFLASQVQDKLPYSITYVNGNDSIFIGNDAFKESANQLMDFCFQQILDLITGMNEQKEKHTEQLVQACMIAANLLVSTSNLSVKKVGSFANKLFKMSDGYLNDIEGGAEGAKGISLRIYINKTFDSFKRKKDAQAGEANIRASIASEASAQ